MDLSHQTQFAVILAQKNGRETVIVVDEALNQASASVFFPWCIDIKLSILRVNSKGLCDDTESERLGDVEDEILDALDSFNYCYAGRITGEGKRQIFLYVHNANEVVSSIHRCVEKIKLSGQDCEVSQNFDPTWQAFRSLRYG